MFTLYLALVNLPFGISTALAAQAIMGTTRDRRDRQYTDDAGEEHLDVHLFTLKRIGGDADTIKPLFTATRHRDRRAQRTHGDERWFSQSRPLRAEGDGRSGQA